MRLQQRNEEEGGWGVNCRVGEKTREVKEGGRSRRKRRMEGAMPEERAHGENREGRRLVEGSRKGRAGLQRGLAAAENVTHFNF